MRGRDCRRKQAQYEIAIITSHCFVPQHPSQVPLRQGVIRPDSSTLPRSPTLTLFLPAGASVANPRDATGTSLVSWRPRDTAVRNMLDAYYES